MSRIRILIAGGGTGGHLFPALAIGEEILSRNSNAKIHYVGSLFGLEQVMASTNPDDYVSRYQPFERDVLGRPMFRRAAYGGYIKGPGTPISDSIPVRVSNTEFINTGKSVAGADPTGQNNPDKGAKVMMGIMKAFERRADNNANARA